MTPPHPGDARHPAAQGARVAPINGVCVSPE